MSPRSSLRLLLVLPMLASSFVPLASTQRYPSSTLLKDSEMPWEGPAEDETLTKFKDEETLLMIHCKPMHDTPLQETVVPRIQEYVRQFRFKRVLPVQPLKASPTDDGGVEVLFRKSALDQTETEGGLRFFVVPQEEGLQVVVKRQSEGQTVEKGAAEKLVVKAFLQAFGGKDREKEYATLDPPTFDVCTMESVFHKWMFWM